MANKSNIFSQGIKSCRNNLFFHPYSRQDSGTFKNTPDRKILLGLTTITRGEWENKVREIDKLGLREIALFLTGLDFKERRELYQLLENTKLTSVPHVHLRNDMEINELNYLNNKFGTEIFNAHPELDPYHLLFDYTNFEKKIYIENTQEYVPADNELKKYAGLCLDLSHWESVKLDKGENSQENLKIKKVLKKYKIAVNHISAIKLNKIIHHDSFLNKDFHCYHSHLLGDLKELDYVKKYKNYLADTISIELENSLSEQLEVKKYLEKILNL
ncbi:MAG: hypothetical protein AAB653_03980 [Patescibacteria group bacterium]